MVVTLKLATHTKFWSAMLIISIVVISIGLYLAYMWISNVAFSDFIQGTTYIAWTTAEPYFITVFCCCLILAIDGVVLFIDFERGGYASRMRHVIEEEREITRTELANNSVHLTDGLTVMMKNE